MLKLKFKRADWKEAFEIALATIASQKTRAFLTTLGVVIGVGSVIIVAATIDGLNGYVSRKINELGSQTFFVTRFQAFTLDFDRLPEEIRTRKHFTAEDAAAVLEQCPAVEKASPILTRAAFLGRGALGGSNEVRFANNLVEEPILRGAEPELLDVLPMHQVREGRFFTHDENDHAAAVAVLGSPIADQLFGPVDAVGQVVRLNGRPFAVVGVFEPHQGLFGGPGVDQFVLIPYKTFHKMYPEIDEVVLTFKARDTTLLRAAMDQVSEVMRRRRHVPAHKPDDFEMTTADLLTDLWSQLTSAIVMLTLMVASIALLVGGIGVMNVMLVSVTERTAEIGVRKAVGARRSDIRSQFLLEAVTLTGVGGALGIVAGVVVSLLIAALVPNLPARVSLFWTVAGLLLSLSVGLFFGIYPAVKAANLDPVRCLRYE
jgi:putative ABC transport system permease protein